MEKVLWKLRDGWVLYPSPPFTTPPLPLTHKRYITSEVIH